MYVIILTVKRKQKPSGFERREGHRVASVAEGKFGVWLHKKVVDAEGPEQGRPHSVHKNTKELYEANERLNEEKNAIQLEAARETIRGNILRAVSHDLRTPLTGISGPVCSSSISLTQKATAIKKLVVSRSSRGLG